MCAWQTQSVMDMIKYVMLNMTTASTVDSDCHAEDFCNNDGVCELYVCLADTECDGYDQICNAQHDNCFYCGQDDCPHHTDGCCPGCHDSALNCEYPTPVCDQASHTCKCNDDSDCHAEDFCNNDGVCELYVCLADTERDGYDQICNAQYDNCFYCGKDDCPHHTDGCCPGKDAISSTHTHTQIQ